MKAIFRNHLFQLISLTVMCTIAIIILFEVSRGNYLLGLKAFLLQFVPLTSPEIITQNHSGYFSAVGGIAIGFAGALVAIRIAAVATNLQKVETQEVIKDRIIYKANHISELNSKLMRSTIEAKRACTTLLNYFMENPSVLISDEKLAIMNIRSNQGVSSDDNAASSDAIVNSIYSNLSHRLSDFVGAVEEIMMDKVYLDVLNTANSEDNNQRFESLSMKNLLQNKGQYLERLAEFKDIILKESDSCDFSSIYHHNQKDFAGGIHPILSRSFVKTYRSDIKHLLMVVKSNNLQPSEAAWLMLGFITLIQKDDGKRYNLGFIFIGLMLGSLIDKQMFNDYLLKEEKPPTDTFNENEKKELFKEISKSIFSISTSNSDRSILSELANMLVNSHSNLKPDFLIIRGASLIQNDNSDKGELKAAQKGPSQ